MAELLEYCLVFLLSTAVGGLSIVAVGSFGPYSQSLEERVGFSTLSDAAYSALTHGNSNVTAFSTDSTISCLDGVFSVSSPHFNASVHIPADCDFRFLHLSGLHLFRFWSVAGELKLEVK